MNERKIEYEKGEILAAGSRKRIWSVKGMDFESGGSVIVEYLKDDKRPFVATQDAGIAVSIFNFLKVGGVSLSYNGSLSATEFLSYRHEQLPVRVVVRKMAFGEFLLRHPDLKEGQVLPGPTVEYFLEAPGGSFNGHSYPIADPLIVDPLVEGGVWDLRPGKRPLNEEGAVCGQVEASEVCGTLSPVDIDRQSRQVFLMLERAFFKLGFNLADLELRFDKMGQMSRSIDYGSLRLVRGKTVFGKPSTIGNLGSEEDRRLVVSLSVRQLGFRQSLLAIVSDKPGEAEAVRVPRLGGLSTLRIFLDKDNCLERMLSLKNSMSSSAGGGVIVYLMSGDGSEAKLLAKSLDCLVLVVPRNKDAAALADDSLFCFSSDSAVKAALRFLAETNPAIYAFLKS